MDNYFKELLKVLGIGAAFASLPLLAALADLQPPWPPSMEYVSATLVMLAALVAWEWTRQSRIALRRRWILTGISLCLLGLFTYLPLYSAFVEARPGTVLRVIRGYECNNRALKVYRDQCPDLPQSALADAEWESVALWTRTSVSVVRLGLAVSWFLFVCGLIATVGAVVAGRNKRVATKVD